MSWGAKSATAHSVSVCVCVLCCCQKGSTTIERRRHSHSTLSTSLSLLRFILFSIASTYLEHLSYIWSLITFVSSSLPRPRVPTQLSVAGSLFLLCFLCFVITWDILLATVESCRSLKHNLKAMAPPKIIFLIVYCLIVATTEAIPTRVAAKAVIDLCNSKSTINFSPLSHERWVCFGILWGGTHFVFVLVCHGDQRDEWWRRSNTSWIFYFVIPSRASRTTPPIHLVVTTRYVARKHHRSASLILVSGCVAVDCAFH